MEIRLTLPSRSPTRSTTPNFVHSMLAALHNPNVAWTSTAGRGPGRGRGRPHHARLVGYDPEQAGGVFTFGGTGTTLYGVMIGLEKVCLGTMQKGLSEDSVLLVSEAGHYCAANIAGWLGMGTDNAPIFPGWALSHQ